MNGAAVSEIAGIALRKGHIGFEGEGHEIAFRNIKLTPLPATLPLTFVPLDS